MELLGFLMFKFLRICSLNLPCTTSCKHLTKFNERKLLELLFFLCVQDLLNICHYPRWIYRAKNLYKDKLQHDQREVGEKINNPHPSYKSCMHECPTLSTLSLWNDWASLSLFSPNIKNLPWRKYYLPSNHSNIQIYF